jgi:signal peptidase I
MSTPWARSRRTAVLCASVLLLLVGARFWPAQLGGSTTYVTTHGTSMQPRFHSGDLAVLRPARDYVVGDVAAYHSKVLGTVVLHRIAAVQNGRFVFKGDHNSWRDPEEVARDQIIGSLQLRVPHGGSWRHAATRPWLLGVVLCVLLLLGVGTPARRRNRRRTPMSTHLRAPRPLRRIGPTTRGVTAVATAMAVGGLAAGLLSSDAMTRVQRDEPAEPAASVSYEYSAAVPLSAAYPGRVANSPDPIFRKVARVVTVRYRYTGPPAQIGSRVELSAGSGWHQTLPGSRPASATSVGAISLDLGALDRRAAAAAAATGIPIGQLMIKVITTIRTGDRVGFEAPLTLQLTAEALTLAQTGAPLTITDERPRAVERVLPGRLGDYLTPGEARLIAVILLTAAALLAAGSASLARRAPGLVDVETIERRYRDLLLAVEPVATPPGTAMIEVRDFDALAKLATCLGLMIVHWSRSGVHTFAVHDGPTVYRLRLGTPAAQEAPQEQTALALA